MDTSISGFERTAALPDVAHVKASRPFVWLKRGLQDLAAHPGPSLAHGLTLVVLGNVILVLCSTHVALVAAAVSGFLLVGPLFAAAFYELSRLRHSGEPVSFDASLEGAVRKGRSLLSLGLVLAVLVIAWVWLSGMLFERAFGGHLPSVADSAYQALSDGNYGTFFLTYMLTGAVFALVAFLISAVAAPMIFDGRADTKTAVTMSIRTVLANPGAMALWAAIIAGLTAIGFATFMLGLVVILPLLGHATWHAYRDLVHGSYTPWDEEDL
ncbi:MAG: DUF2189 domain-containing protein [Burkholderiales bacterium]|nr:DUF2189 domain-containing protein [Burkholderiales bacterium]